MEGTPVPTNHDLVGGQDGSEVLERIREEHDAKDRSRTERWCCPVIERCSLDARCSVRGRVAKRHGETHDAVVWQRRQFLGKSAGGEGVRDWGGREGMAKGKGG